MAIGDTNYGEGSSREHAAMEPRHLGCAVVLAKSFARIAETNLKKQGILVLQFVNPDDYKKIGEEDRITVPPDQLEIEVGKSVILTIEHAADLSETIETSHSFSSEQIAWFKAGSALNWIREK